MSEVTLISAIPMEDFAERVESGLLVPMGAEEGLKIVDCGDVRPLTAAAEGERHDFHGGEVVPGRYFGGRLGLGAATLITVAAQTGERFMDNFLSDYGPEALATFSADLSARAESERNGLEFHLHSANGNEANDAEVDLDQPPEIPLGCKFATYLGAVLMLASGERALQEAEAIAAITGQELPLDEAREGARILGKHLPPAFSVGREALRYAADHGHGRSPHTILKGDAVANSKTAVVIDMADYRSSAGRHMEAGLPRYHHTPGIAVSELPGLLPEYKLEPGLLSASSLLLGTATREALSGPESPHELGVEVIPHEYSLAA